MFLNHQAVFPSPRDVWSTFGYIFWLSQPGIREGLLVPSEEARDSTNTQHCFRTDTLPEIISSAQIAGSTTCVDQ